MSSGTSGSTGALRLTRPTRTMSVAGKRYRAGSWVSPWVRPGFAATEVVPSWAASTPRNTLDPGRGARHRPPWPAHQLGQPGPLGRPRRDFPPHQPRQPARRPRTRRDRHLARQRRRLPLLAAAADAAAPGRDEQHATRRRDRRDGLGTAARTPRHDVEAGNRARPGPQGPPLLADDPPRGVPALRRWRRGVVLADVDRDGAPLLPQAAAAQQLRLGEEVLHRPGRRPGRAHDLRPRVRRHGQLALQHRLRREPHRPRVRDEVRAASGASSGSSRRASPSSRRSRSAAAS